MATVVHRANLNQQVYERLRARILSRDLGPEAKLSLHELATELGVSRSPVHHALTRLVTEGLLTVRPRRGYYVNPVTERDLLESYDVRLALELHAGAIAPVVTDEQVAELRRLLEATAEARSYDEWHTTNAAFHEWQVDLAGNTLLSRFYRELSANLLIQVIRRGHVDQVDVLVAEHGAIVEAFEARDADAVRVAVGRHVETGREIGLEAIRGAGGAL